MNVNYADCRVTAYGDEPTLVVNANIIQDIPKKAERQCCGEKLSIDVNIPKESRLNNPLEEQLKKACCRI